MLKKSSTYKRYAALPLLGWVFSAQFAHAQATFLGYNLGGLVTEIAAWFSNILLQIMSLWITMTGALLNVSISLTLHIKDFVDQTAGVYAVWQTIRDVSGMFIIFMLLYASFKIILGFDTVGGVGGLIKNIVIVGILINFSFFITSLLIDASNIVSLALYNGIVGSGASTSSNVNISAIASQTLNGSSNGGLSDIFMQKLGVQGFYGPGSKDHANAVGNADKALQIVIQGIVGSIIMFTVGFSFLLASLAFVVRLIILILLLAFSPIWFAARVIPQIGARSKHFEEQLYAQLIFMPVYLLLLYAAMRVLASTTVFTDPGSTASALTTGSIVGYIPLNYIILAINDFFVIFLLNMPLVVAFSMGGHATEFLSSATKKFDAKNMWRNVGGFAGRNTVGSLGYKLQNDLNKRFPVAANTLVGQAIIKNTAGWAANSGYGSGTSRTAAVDAAKKRAEAASAGQRANQRNADLKAAIASGDHAKVRAALAPLTTNEKANLNKKMLLNDLVMQHLDDATHKAIDNHKTLTDKDKVEIANARAALLKTAVANNSGTTVQNMMKNASGDALTDFANDAGNATAVKDPLFIDHLRESQLKNMDSIDPSLRKAIGDRIRAVVAAGGRHPAFDYINKNSSTWS